MFKFLKIPNNKWWGMLIHWGIMLSIVAIGLVLYFYVYLPFSTNHGEHILVPELKGKTLSAAEAELSAKNLEWEVTETIWTDNESEEKGTIVFHHPKAGSEVKEGRKIYITVKAEKAPNIDIDQRTFGQITAPNRHEAQFAIKKLNLKYRTYFEDSPHRNLVLRVEYRGRTIRPGDQLPYGAEVELVLGNGKLEEEVQSEDQFLNQMDTLDPDLMGILEQIDDTL